MATHGGWSGELHAPRALSYEARHVRRYRAGLAGDSCLLWQGQSRSDSRALVPLVRTQSLGGASWQARKCGWHQDDHCSASAIPTAHHSLTARRWDEDSAVKEGDLSGSDCSDAPSRGWPASSVQLPEDRTAADIAPHQNRQAALEVRYSSFPSQPLAHAGCPGRYYGL